MARAFVRRARGAFVSAWAAWRSPLGLVLTAALALRLTGLTWGLPASDGWDDDGVAPRDFLVGVAMTYWPGHHYTYPPLQLLLLALASAPVWATALARAPSLAPDVVIHTFIAVPTMTALAVVARAISAAMSIGVLWTIARIGRELGGTRRAGVWAAAACGCSSVFTYYAQTTNLEVPYLFWSTLALEALVRALLGRDVRALRRVPLLAAMAVATKDQAYAMFLAGLPLAAVTWIAVDPWARARSWLVLRELALGACLGLALLAVVDGAIINPSGFADRVHMLLGSASQDHAFYPKSAAGRLAALRDTLLAFPQFYSWAFAPWTALGVWRVVRAQAPEKRAAGLAPLWLALSFTFAFNATARRSELRFELPQTTVWGLYAGLAFDAFTSRAIPGGRWARGLSWAVAGLCVAIAVFRCLAVDAAMVLDPRYDAEAWLRAQVRPGDHIEAYGNNVHLPRFPAAAVVERVDPSPIDGRNPLPGVLEVSDRFSNVDARHPRFIVVSEFWAHRYLMEDDDSEGAGRVFSPAQQALQTDTDSRKYFHALRDGATGYRWAHRSEFSSAFWPEVDIHESLSQAVWIFERPEAAD
jgi:hypothetical protein